MNASLVDVASLAELFAPIRLTPGSGSSCAAAPLGTGACPSAEAFMKLWRTQVAFTHFSATSGWISSSRRNILHCAAQFQTHPPPPAEPGRDGSYRHVALG
ncbi:hypothetical protein CRENBAI_008209 [Crenichthys baileyi]|uniref:Uncharacterized protein n=1 Tax=Crenichthys baileyi TaxID=28760 RepID=A0AAV9SLQ3_9TELE